MAEKIRVLDLFAGAGGLSIGFDLVKDSKGEKVYEIVLAVDNDKYACETLKKYFEKEFGNKNIVLEVDLTDKKSHNKIIELCDNRVDLIIGGPPCQSFSLIGPRSGYGGSRRKKYKQMNELYTEYLKLVKELKPSFVVLENVKGILSKKDTEHGFLINKIIADFERLGYNFENESVKAKYIILNAADYGVPQTRERVFLIGNNLGKKNPYPDPTHQENHVTLFESIGDLPKLKAKITFTGTKKKERKVIESANNKTNSGSDKVPFHTTEFKRHYNSLNQKGKAFLDFIKPNGIDTLTHHIARSQKKDDITLFKKMKQGMTAGDIFNSKKNSIKMLKKLIKYNMTSFRDKYKKQSWDKPCSTVFAHLEKDGNRFIHPDSSQARTITPREAARIQSFPDYYEFEGPFSKKFRQIGNAVPPLLAYNIGKTILKIFGE